MIFALLEGTLGGPRVRDDWLEPGVTKPCRTLSSSGGLLWCTYRWDEVHYSKESPRASGFLCPAERGGVFLRE